ncbi:MAG: hypothetical protein HYS06_11110 [Methylocystis sp.]|nr:hypothetical protein [Methylocystis sp.]
MTPSNLRSKSFLAWASLAPALAVGALAAPQPAAAQFYFRPFAYFYRAIEEPAPDVSPPRMASILRREGFRLDGPLGRRGDQVVATGVDAKGRRMRFIIDPYEGEVLSSRRVEPAFAPEDPHDGVARAEPLAPDEAIEPQPPGPRVIPGIGGDGPGAEIPPPSPPRPAARPRAKAARAGANPRRGAAYPAASQGTSAAPAPAAPTITPPTPASTAEPPVPAQATTAPPAAPPAAASDAAPVAAPAAPAEATAAPAQPATPAAEAGTAAPTNTPAAVPPPPQQDKSPSADKSPSSVGG